MRVVVEVEDVRIPCSFCGGRYLKFCSGRSHVAVCVCVCVCVAKGRKESISAFVLKTAWQRVGGGEGSEGRRERVV